MLARNSSRRDFLFIILASISWGTVGVANQALYAYSATNALSLAFFRLVIAAPLFLLVSWIFSVRRIFHVKLRDLGIMLLMGGMQALYQVAYSASIPYTGVTIATLVALCAAPIIVVLFSSLVAHERSSWTTLLALICALCGTFLLVGARSQRGETTISLFGVLLAFLAACGYAGFILCGRLLTTRYHPLQVNTIAFATGALLLLGSTVATKLVLTYPLWGWLLLLYLGCVPTALAYGLFQAGMRSLSATVVSIVTLCEPLTAAVLAWLLFHEDLGVLGIVGAVLLLGSLLLLVYKK